MEAYHCGVSRRPGSLLLAAWLLAAAINLFHGRLVKIDAIERCQNMIDKPGAPLFAVG